MRKLFLIIFVGLLSNVMLYSQENHSENPSKTPYARKFYIVTECCYEQLFIKDAGEALESSWAIAAPAIGVDYLVTDNIYVGTSVGFCVGSIHYDMGDMNDLYSSLYDIRFPLRAGLSFANRKIRFDTGPFVDFAVGGETQWKAGKTETTTKLRDMDVSRVSLGWSINLKLFNILKVGYSFILTDSPYGEGGDIGFLSVGLSFSI